MTAFRIASLLLITVSSALSFTSSFTVGPISSRKFSSSSAPLQMNFLSDLLGGGGKTFAAPCVMGDESIMSRKAHGTSEVPIQKDLRWDCNIQMADQVCNFNRHGAENRGYWDTTSFYEQAKKEFDETGEVKFYDSNTGKLLFMAPKERTFDNFIKESVSHGWPSFRDSEVNWEYVRCLSNGESVSVDGTHLGHNLPDGTGSRYCINLVSVAGRPVEEK
mmetsp:Transcript_7515/g.12522  ORF Transcript_7515/g.12522 Transcript_7515/m.12522 type:complete len:219 (+) Transcript_7515:107-763(+)|eukprot:CAMPEP_0119013478 /NCGR_PEP_ID=MMETSP1176-20130426/8472_1 /TAXON_ID=265551 /ORGANISM="Synedropsis recta cf, Strain CCMP1620" /LENGTH=218 /DNA_ID=CAMNT_0006966571 /DNA_START=102 /DNA_END=758 /DNA_ORIENTATION=-